MTTEALRIEALKLLKFHGLFTQGWKFVIDPQTHSRRLGQCRFKQKEIALSRWYIELNQDNDEALRDTLLHEIAHALAFTKFGEVGHGPYWRAACKMLGCKPIRCKVFDAVVPGVVTIKAPIPQYVSTCETCGKRMYRNKLPREPRVCREHIHKALIWHLNPEYVANRKAAAQVREETQHNPDEVVRLLDLLANTRDAKERKKIRARLRALGHRGGLR